MNSPSAVSTAGMEKSALCQWNCLFFWLQGIGSWTTGFPNRRDVNSILANLWLSGGEQSFMLVIMPGLKYLQHHLTKTSSLQSKQAIDIDWKQNANQQLVVIISAMSKSRPNPLFIFHSPVKVDNQLYRSRQLNSHQLYYYPAQLEAHRVQILQDYQRKVNQIKVMRERLRQLGAPNNEAGLRIKSYRGQTKMGKRNSRTVETVRQSFLKTSTFQLRETSAPRDYLELSPFQKTSLQRIRAREEVAVKKKFHSLHLSHRHFPYQPDQTHSFRLLTDCPLIDQLAKEARMDHSMIDKNERSQDEISFAVEKGVKLSTGRSVDRVAHQ